MNVPVVVPAEFNMVTVVGVLVSTILPPDKSCQPSKVSLEYPVAHHVLVVSVRVNVIVPELF